MLQDESGNDLGLNRWNTIRFRDFSLLWTVLPKPETTQRFDVTACFDKSLNHARSSHFKNSFINNPSAECILSWLETFSRTKMHDSIVQIYNCTSFEKIQKHLLLGLALHSIALNCECVGKFQSDFENTSKIFYPVTYIKVETGQNCVICQLNDR
jgi:hypothetical protein